MALSHAGPIIIVEDDLDDQEMVDSVLKELKISNKLVYFTHPNKVFDFLKNNTDPLFLIICDINLPVMNGLELKRLIDEDPELRQKSIPFVFFSTSADLKTVEDAYENLTVQGFFKKCNSFAELQNTLSAIIQYWKLCKHPNSV